MSTDLKISLARREDDETLFSRDFDGRLIRLDKVTDSDLEKNVTITIDGRPVTVRKATPATDSQGNFLKDDKGKIVPRPTTVYDAACKIFATGTVFQAADVLENPIPILCHREHMDPVAVCRVCVVEISQVVRGSRRTERKLYPACQLRVDETMEVSTRATSETVRKTVDTLTELLMADHPSPCAKEKQTRDCELEALAKQFEIPEPRFARRPPRAKDDSSVVIAVDHDACIMCDRCVRSCNDIRNNQVIGRAGKGYTAKIAFDLDNPMGNSSCVACGECMIYCPTGALTSKAVIDQKPWEGMDPPAERIHAEDLIRHPIAEIRRSFRGATPAFLRWNEGSIVRRRYKKGQIICREGEFGATAFLIESGAVDIYLNAALGQAHSRPSGAGGLFGLMRKVTLDLVSKKDDRGERRYIATDAPVALDSNRPAATLGPGDIFGEMTCMNSYPRGATVRAAEDVVVLEFMRNVLYIMQRNKNFRAALEQKYRERAIANHLRSVAIFAPIREDEVQFRAFVDGLRQTVRLTRADPGDVIFRQDDPGDSGFFLVRSGFVKVAQNRPGGEHVLNYVGPGGYFGEIALMADIDEVRRMTDQRAGRRTATCSALDHVDLVQITAADFRDLLATFPKVREPLVKEAIRRLEENAKAMGRAEAVPLGEFLSQGLMNANSLLVLDLEKCTRCDECTKACADTHDGVTRLIREGLRFDKFLVASSCRSCLDPYCLVGCPTGAIGRKGTLEILIDDTCIGCGRCSENCPYGNINMHGFPKMEEIPGKRGKLRQVKTEDPSRAGRMIPVIEQKATMCDLCHDIGTPSCVYACPHDAAHRMTGRELIDLVDLAQRR